MSTGQEDSMIQELLELEEGLSDWEVQFIESLDNQSSPCTERQAEKLYEIWRAKF